jgi:hypothetical protein
MGDIEYDLLDRLISFIHRALFCRLGKHFFTPLFLDGLDTPYFCHFCGEDAPGNKKPFMTDEEAEEIFQ